MNNSENYIPLIYINSGNAPLYLILVLLHARKTQPNSRIILITSHIEDKYSKDLIKNKIEIYNINMYFSEANKFEKYYQNKHMSPNSYAFELICFQRWFILLEFIKQNSIINCFHCDTDMMPYSDLTEIANLTLKNKGVSVVKDFGPQCTYFDIKTLNLFCNFITNYYSNPLLFQKLKKLYTKKMLNKDGGICDMTILGFFASEHKKISHDFWKLRENHIFDNRLGDDTLVETRNGIEFLRFTNNLPYGISKNDHSKIYFDIIHFQGKEKYYIGRYSFAPLKYKILFFINYFNLEKLFHDHIIIFLIKVKDKLNKSANFKFIFSKSHKK